MVVIQRNESTDHGEVFKKCSFCKMSYLKRYFWLLKNTETFANAKIYTFSLEGIVHDKKNIIFNQSLNSKSYRLQYDEAFHMRCHCEESSLKKISD